MLYSCKCFNTSHIVSTCECVSSWRLRSKSQPNEYKWGRKYHNFRFLQTNELNAFTKWPMILDCVTGWQIATCVVILVNALHWLANTIGFWRVTGTHVNRNWSAGLGVPLWCCLSLLTTVIACKKGLYLPSTTIFLVMYI